MRFTSNIILASIAAAAPLAEPAPAPELAERQLLTDAAPQVSALLAGLGLPNVGAPVGGVLTAASDNLKKRDPQLLADAAPQVSALLAGLGLPNVGVPVGGVLTAA